MTYLSLSSVQPGRGGNVLVHHPERLSQRRHLRKSGYFSTQRRTTDTTRRFSVLLLRCWVTAQRVALYRVWCALCTRAMTSGSWPWSTTPLAPPPSSCGWTTATSSEWKRRIITEFWGWGSDRLPLLTEWHYCPLLAKPQQYNIARIGLMVQCVKFDKINIVSINTLIKIWFSFA